MKTKRIKVGKHYKYTIVDERDKYIFKSGKKIIAWDKKEAERIEKVIEVFGVYYATEHYSK